MGRVECGIMSRDSWQANNGLDPPLTPPPPTSACGRRRWEEVGGGGGWQELQTR